MVGLMYVELAKTVPRENLQRENVPGGVGQGLGIQTDRTQTNKTLGVYRGTPDKGPCNAELFAF